MSSNSIRLSSLLCLAGVLLVVAACAGKDDPPRNGVDDVVKACQIRVGWKNAASEKCQNCLAAAPSPACDCESFKEFAGLCKQQDDARRAEPSCTGAMEDCSRACKDDCACIAACYDQAAACRRVIDGRDGCIADVCSPYCN